VGCGGPSRRCQATCCLEASQTPPQPVVVVVWCGVWCVVVWCGVVLCCVVCLCVLAWSVPQLWLVGSGDECVPTDSNCFRATLQRALTSSFCVRREVRVWMSHHAHYTTRHDTTRHDTTPYHSTQHHTTREDTTRAHTRPHHNAPNDTAPNDTAPDIVRLPHYHTDLRLWRLWLKTIEPLTDCLPQPCAQRASYMPSVVYVTTHVVPNMCTDIHAV
jgi:hypothetical protein